MKTGVPSKSQRELARPATGRQAQMRHHHVDPARLESPQDLDRQHCRAVILAGNRKRGHHQDAHRPWLRPLLVRIEASQHSAGQARARTPIRDTSAARASGIPPWLRYDGDAFRPGSSRGETDANEAEADFFGPPRFSQSVRRTVPGDAVESHLCAGGPVNPSRASALTCFAAPTGIRSTR